MCNLTDRQRFALRESLCDLLGEYSERCSATSYDLDAVADARSMLGKEPQGVKEWARHFTGLVELLGEWPVGYRGEGGWERIEL